MIKIKVKLLAFVVLLAIGATTSIFYISNHKSIAKSQSLDDYNKPFASSIFKGSYGQVKKSDSEEIDLNKNRTIYRDNKYKYTFRENGKLLSIIEENESPEKNKEVNLSKEDAIKKVKESVNSILPSLNYNNVVIEAELRGGNEPWQVTIKYKVGEEQIVTGMILAKLNKLGEISALIIDGEFNEEHDNSNNFISKEKAISIA